MIVYHLGKTKYARQLNGEGARLNGGRWNAVGQPCIYASEARSLCVLEYAANVYLDEMADELSFSVYEIPDEAWVSFPIKDLPDGWGDPSAPVSVKEWGTTQLKKSFALRLPSVIIPTEFNFVLNPLHPDFKKLRIKGVESFTFDRRIKQ